MSTPVGVTPDAAGGPVIATQAWYRIDLLPVVRLGDPVTSHGNSPHDAVVMASSTLWYRIDMVGVCRAVDVASCGHTLAASRMWFRVE